MMKRHLLIINALCLILALTSCDRRRNDKGYEYFPDMAHSLTYETYQYNPVLGNGQSMSLPAPNTVPMEMQPYPYDATPEGRELAAMELVNPHSVNEEALIKGKEQYTIFCSHCHGEKGNGDGFLYTSGKYVAKPASLLSEKMKSSNEADIYHVITVGYQLMGPHGHMIRPDERWMIAIYVKNELQKQ
jgi:mono/diheme cytochrome c family protein